MCVFKEIYVAVFDREPSKVENPGKMGSRLQKLSDQPPYRFLIICKNYSFGDEMGFHLTWNILLWLNLVKFYPPPLAQQLDHKGGGGGGKIYVETPCL